jgi:hypothetical protein
MEHERGLREVAIWQVIAYTDRPDYLDECRAGIVGDARIGSLLSRALRKQALALPRSRAQCCFGSNSCLATAQAVKCS